MRPRSLRIEGFVCFREPVEIDFTGLDVFVISGPTGAGKTTIIDAMCYALYGEVPRQTKVQDLIARDAPAMRVQLEFDAGGARYRVHRGINITRSTVKKTGAEKVTRDISPVQFEIYGAGDWQPLADRVAEIDRAIVDAVGLDFDGFTRCVLLPQGRFAEFFAGSPPQRRALLTELLDIGIYGRVKVAANARAAQLSAQVEGRERQLRDDYAGATVDALAAAQTEITEARPKLDAAREQRAALQDAHTHATTYLAAYASELEQGKQLKAKLAQKTEAESLAEGGKARLRTLEAGVTEAETALGKSAFDQERHTALRMAQEAVRRVETCRAESERATIAATKLDPAAAERAVVAAEELLAAARQRTTDVEEALEAEKRADAAAHVRSGLKAGDTCPVCGETIRKIAKAAATALAPVQQAVRDAKAAETKSAQDASKAANELARLQQQAKNATEIIEKATADLAREESALKSVLPKGIEPIADAVTAAFDEQERARMLHESLAQAFDAGRNALADHERAIFASKEQIAILAAEARQLEEFIERDAQVRKEAAGRVREIAARWHWSDVDALIAAQKSPAPALKALLNAAQSEADELNSRIARLEQDAQIIEKSIERAAELRRELAEMKERWQLCRELGTLLRDDNFPKFVIVEAMQSLAAAASEHLETLYDRYAIGVDGGEFTVIDHWGADQAREAKTLSGGETFVASLALALALSERLPELRSAAASSLESLFLDEGFGTLDPETLAAVIAALDGLASEERMVGIITHVPELAARFEHKITVQKSPEGSNVVMS